MLDFIIIVILLQNTQEITGLRVGILIRDQIMAGSIQQHFFTRM